MKKVLKIILDKLILLVIAFVVFGAVIGVVWYIITADLREVDRKNKADPAYQKIMAEAAEKEKEEKEKQKKLDEINEKQREEDKAIADFEKSVTGKYSKEYLLKMIKSDKKMADHLTNIGGYDCMSYWYTSHDLNDDLCYDELSYYIFENKNCAKDAFSTMKEEWIESETDSGKNYVQGWEAGVCDASVELFIYQTDNMIITTELQVVSGWAEPEDEEDDNSSVEFYYRKSFIKKNF